MDPEDLKVTSEHTDEIFTPLSLINQSSEALLRSETRRYDKGAEAVINRVMTTARQIEFRFNRILNRAHTDGNLATAASEMADAYRTNRDRIMNSMTWHFERAGAQPGLIVDMRPVYTRLQELRQQDRQLARMAQDAADTDDYVPFSDDPEMRRLNTHIEELARDNKNMLTPEFLAGTEADEATTPIAPSAGRSAAHVEDELYGTPTRISYNTNGRTPEERQFSTTYRVMNLGDIITSHKVQGGNIPTASDNPDFDSALQPKDMKLASQLSIVMQLARTLIPELILGGYRTIQSGTPILDSRDMTISGNHRLEALRVVYQMFPETAQAYREALPAEMARFGLTDDIDSMPEPVLVRVLDDDVDVYQFARAGNVADTSELSETSQANQDLHIVDNELFGQLDVGDGAETLDNLLQADSNGNFRRNFVQRLATAERPQFVNEAGELSRGGRTRMANALMAKVFNGPFGVQLRSIFTEGASAGFKNIQRAIQDALPAFIRLRRHTEGADYDIAEPLAEAILKLQSFRQDATSGQGVQAAINSYLDAVEQEEGGTLAGLFGDAEDEAFQVRDLDERGRSLLRVLAVGVDRRTSLREFLREYGIRAGQAAGIGQGQTIGDLADAVRDAQQRQADVDEADIATAVGVPAEELLDTLSARYVKAYEEGVADELKAGLTALFQYADEADAAADAAVDASGKKPVQMVDPPSTAQPILFENILAYRNALQATLISGRVGPRLQAWRTQVVAALDDAILDTLAIANPDKASMAPLIRNMMRDTQETLNSEYARLAADLLSGARNPTDPAVQKAMETFFTPSDTPESVNQKYRLVGHEVGKRVRRIFLAKILDFIHTEAGTADAGAVARGEQALADISQRYRADGIRRYMNQFITSATNYTDETLVAILGQRTVRDLYELDIILQDFGRFMKRAGKDELFFGEQTQANMMHRIMDHLGWQLIGGGIGGLGGVVGGLPVMGALAVVGATVGTAAKGVSTAVFNAMYNSRLGRRYLLNGIERAWRDAWDAGTRVLLRNPGGPAGGWAVEKPQYRSGERKAARQEFAEGGDDDTRTTTKTEETVPPSSATVRTAVRTGRTASKREDEE